MNELTINRSKNVCISDAVAARLLGIGRTSLLRYKSSGLMDDCMVGGELILYRVLVCDIDRIKRLYRLNNKLTIRA